MDAGTDLSPRGLARIVVDFMEALDLRDVTLVGNDTGGAICQIVVAEHPKRIGRLVLTNCDAYEAFFPLVLRPLQCGARLFQEAGRQETTESRASYFTESWEVISIRQRGLRRPCRAASRGRTVKGGSRHARKDPGCELRRRGVRSNSVNTARDFLRLRQVACQHFGKCLGQLYSNMQPGSLTNDAGPYLPQRKTNASRFRQS